MSSELATVIEKLQSLIYFFKVLLTIIAMWELLSSMDRHFFP